MREALVEPLDAQLTGVCPLVLPMQPICAELLVDRGNRTAEGAQRVEITVVVVHEQWLGPDREPLFPGRTAGCVCPQPGRDVMAPGRDFGYDRAPCQRRAP